MKRPEVRSSAAGNFYEVKDFICTTGAVLYSERPCRSSGREKKAGRTLGNTSGFVSNKL